jgi:hypothetical protein
MVTAITLVEGATLRRLGGAHHRHTALGMNIQDRHTQRRGGAAGPATVLGIS